MELIVASLVSRIFEEIAVALKGILRERVQQLEGAASCGYSVVAVS